MPGTVCFHSSISMTIPRTIFDFQNNIQSKNKKKWSPLWLLYPCNVGSFAVCLLSMFLHVVTTKVATHFSDNEKWLKVYKDQEIKIVNFADDTNFFWGDINSFARLKLILILYEKASSPKIKLFKKTRHYQLLRGFGEVIFINLFVSIIGN